MRVLKFEGKDAREKWGNEKDFYEEINKLIAYDSRNLELHVQDIDVDPYTAFGGVPPDQRSDCYRGD